MEALMTPQQIAAVLGVKLATVYKWTHTGYIPHIKLGKFVRFRNAEIEIWLNRKSRSGRSQRRIVVDELIGDRKTREN